MKLSTIIVNEEEKMSPAANRNRVLKKLACLWQPFEIY